MPPLQALAALHGLWCLGFLPLVFWATRSWSARRLRLCGRLSTLAAILGFGVLIGSQIIFWLPHVPSESRQYLPQRVAFTIATSTNVPLVQSLLAGVVCWIVGRRRMTLGDPLRTPMSR